MSVTQAEIETDDDVVLPVEAIHAATGRGSGDRVSFITEPGSTASQADDDSLNASAAALSGLSAESVSSSKGGTGTSNGAGSGTGTESGSKSKSTSDPPASGVSSLTNTAAPDAIPPTTATSLASQDSWSGVGGIDRHQPRDDEEAEVDYGYENVSSSMGNNSGLSNGSNDNQNRGVPTGKTMLEVWRSGRRLSDGASRTFQRSYSQLRANSTRSLASTVIQEDSVDEADDDGDKALPVWKRTMRNCRSSQTYISCLIDDLQWALMSLNSSRSQDLQHLEDMAIFIHDSQSVESRLYHNIARVFEVTGGASPIQLLAAFFRDTVHHFIDGEITTLVLQKMASLQRHAFVPDTFQVNPDLFRQHDDVEQDDAQSASATTASSSSINKTMKLTRMVVKLFGYQPNLDLESFYQWKHGMDVFLSCLVAVQYLQDSLSLKQLAELITCLEGTIHFRPSDPTTGHTAIEQLFHRLTAVNSEYMLELSDVEMELACQQSADLHNRLLGSFVTHDPRTFLDHTWSLLPEQNINLRKTYLYSLNDFYSAVMNMKDFMVNSKTLVMYSSFRGIPPTWEMEEFQRLFQNNHDLGLAYLSSMLCGVGIIVAFATLTGGADVPKSLFFGDLQSRSSSSSQGEEIDPQLQQGPDGSTSVRMNAFCLGDGLPRLLNVADDCKPQIYDILKEGRQGETTFDHRNAPISAYVYGTLGESEQNMVLGHCIYPMTKESSWELLERLPMDLTKAIAREIANVAVSRTHLVYNVLTELAQRDSFKNER